VYRVLDLFSGIGGFSLGLERAGMRTVAFCEVDKKCQLVLKKHWPTVPIFDDVTSLKANEINEPIEIICGGFPCQDISLAGHGAGLEGERSGLWWEFHRLIKEIKPSWAIIENVSALRSRGLDQVLGSLYEIGYDAEWHCITASSVGAPHRRDRIWIVAYPKCVGRETRPSKSGKLADEKPSHNSSNGSKGCGESNSSQEMAYSNLKRSQGGSNSRSCEDVGEAGTQSTGSSSARQSETLAHAKSTGLERRLFGGDHESAITRFRESRRAVQTNWITEPDVGRVAHGVSGRVDRLKQLGNAVVPQIPELIGRAIMEYDRG
jgi:DNA (cytosine-5)-methyltransferase 1